MYARQRLMVKHPCARYGKPMSNQKRVMGRTRKHVKNPINLTLRSKFKFVSGSRMYVVSYLLMVTDRQGDSYIYICVISGSTSIFLFAIPLIPFKMIFMRRCFSIFSSFFWYKKVKFSDINNKIFWYQKCYSFDGKNGIHLIKIKCWYQNIKTKTFCYQNIHYMFDIKKYFFISFFFIFSNFCSIFFRNNFLI